MIHIAIEAVGAKYGGSATGLNNILEAAIMHPKVGRITLFCTPRQKRSHEIPHSEKLVEIPKPWIEANYGLRLLWYRWLAGLECRRIDADVLLISANFGKAGLGIPHVTYVRQSLPFSQEAMNTLTKRARMVNRIRWMAMANSCRAASRVVCQSAVMKNTVADSFTLDLAKVETCYSSPKSFGSSNAAKFVNPDGSKAGNRCRLLYVGGDYAYKKIDTAVQGLKLIQRQFPETELTLTFPTDHHYASLHGVKCVGYLHNDQLADAYRSADILVLPSLVESGPQPPIEAMSLGTPVLIADRPYAHDICGDAAMFFDPLSPQDFADKTIRLLQDQELRQTLIKQGFELIEKRRTEKPYERIIDICVDVALEAQRQRELA